MERIRTAEVTEDELKTAKDTALNSLVFAFDTRTKTLGRMLTYEYFGYPEGFHPAVSEGAGGGDARRRAAGGQGAPRARQSSPIVAVGNPEDFGKPLDSLGSPVHRHRPDHPAPRSRRPADRTRPALEKGKQTPGARAASGRAAPTNWRP